MIIMTVACIIVVIFVCLMIPLYFRAQRAMKIAVLTRKYEDATLAISLADRNIWVGMPREQLLESWGRPSKRREHTHTSDLIKEYKYTKIRGNQFRARVTLENDIVVGWTPNTKLSMLQKLGMLIWKHRQTPTST